MKGVAAAMPRMAKVAEAKVKKRILAGGVMILVVIFV